MKPEDLHIGRVVRIRNTGRWNGFICPVISEVVSGYVALAHEEFPHEVDDYKMDIWRIDKLAHGWLFCRFPLKEICLRV